MKKLFTTLLILLVAGAASYWYWSNNQKSAGAGSQSPSAARAPAKMTLKAVKLAPQTVTTYLELPGRTVASKLAEIRPQVTGLITDRLFEEGGLVKEGDALYQIDPAPYQANYDSAVADLRKAEASVDSIRAKLRRYEQLVKIKAVSVQEYDDIQTSLAPAEADIAIAKAAISKAKIDLDYTRVYAPISGRIGKSSVTKGTLVTAGQSMVLARITMLDPIYVDMALSSEDLMWLRDKFKDVRNIPISVFLEGQKKPYAHEGRIQFYEVRVDETTGSVPLRAQFPNPDEVLLPGLFVRARLSLSYADVLTVPQYAATRNPDGSLSVWILDDKGQAQSARVTAHTAADGEWVVEEGLKAGDVVITEGMLKLSAGAVVEPVFENPAGNSSNGAS